MNQDTSAMTETMSYKDQVKRIIGFIFEDAQRMDEHATNLFHRFDDETGMHHVTICIGKHPLMSHDEDYLIALEGLHIEVGRFAVWLSAYREGVREKRASNQ